MSPQRASESVDDSADGSWLAKMNAEADQWTSYKLLFIARHGEGVHNQVSPVHGPSRYGGVWLTFRRSSFMVEKPGTATGRC